MLAKVGVGVLVVPNRQPKKMAYSTHMLNYIKGPTQPTPSRTSAQLFSRFKLSPKAEMHG